MPDFRISRRIRQKSPLNDISKDDRVVRHNEKEAPHINEGYTRRKNKRKTNSIDPEAYEEENAQMPEDNLSTFHEKEFIFSDDEEDEDLVSLIILFHYLILYIYRKIKDIQILFIKLRKTFKFHLLRMEFSFHIYSKRINFQIHYLNQALHVQ